MFSRQILHDDLGCAFYLVADGMNDFVPVFGMRE